MGNIICGDCLEVMRGMDAASVDAVITDPPYGLSFMGKDWDHGIPGEPFWHEALRVAKPGAHLLAFGGTRTHHRLMCAIEDAGWEIRDTLGWIFGQGFPKSHNLKGEREGWGTALKPAWEPIILARKPLDGTVAANVTKWGTGAVNVDGCRIESDESTVRTVGKTAADGWGLNRQAGLERGSNKGRWPANIIHDGSDEVLELFPQTTSGKESADGHVRRKNTVQYGGFGGQDIGDSAGALYGDSGSAARFFKACPFENGEAFRFAYCAKASRKEREMGLDDLEVKHITCRPQSDDEDDRTIQERLHGRKARNHHPTVKPVALMRYLCRLVTPPNGLILDPFCGSGTTGIAAHAEGFRFIGIDNNAEYVEIAERRINGANRD